MLFSLTLCKQTQQYRQGVCRVGAPGAEVFGHGCHTILLDMVQRQVGDEHDYQ